MTLFEELQARRLLEQHSDPALAGLLAGAEGPLTAYCGFDPTGPSFHVGHLVQVIGLMRLQRAGHHPIALVGGATGLIGDPSFKAQERPLLTAEQIADNVAGLRAQMGTLWEHAGLSAPLVVNNYDWFAEVRFVEFLRDIGKHFSVNAMIAKDSVRTRLHEREQGISFTEFSYMLLQAYDFLWLFDHHQCRLQLGGNDQWGNITEGIELIRRKRGRTAYGFTQPLITNSDGRKFGKSEQGAVWLDPARTSPYQLYQFFLNTDDRDVIRFLRYFTFLPLEEIADLEARGAAARELREPQRVLARQATRLVHGDEEARKAEAAAEALFGGARERQATSVSATLEAALAAGAPSSTLERGELDGAGLAIVQLLSRPGVALCGSLSAARRDIAQGGIYLNEDRVSDPSRQVVAADLIEGNLLLLRKGKKTFHIVRVA